jgi:adenosylmethionine-8-amino-7-oxononanoate aminotransferase
VGLVSGGSEAMEAVIKACIQYWHEVKEPKRVNFIARTMSYHGVTLGALALCNHPARRAIYEPILKHDTFHYVSPAFHLRWGQGMSEEEYTQHLANELDAKFQELGPDTVAAFCAETVVGATTGAVPPPKGYFKAMKAVCDKYGALFVLDEWVNGSLFLVSDAPQGHVGHGPPWHASRLANVWGWCPSWVSSLAAPTILTSIRSRHPSVSQAVAGARQA